MVVKKLVFTTAVLGITIAFVLGILLGWLLSTAKLSATEKIIKDTELNTESFLLEQDLVKTLGTRGCDAAHKRILELGTQLYSLGKSLSSTRETNEFQSDYNILKRQFHLLQIRTYTLNYKLKQDCNSTNPVVLFYYSQNSTQSAEQGAILDNFVSLENAQVYAIEFNYSQDLRFLEEYYNITSTPTLVINYDKTFEGLASLEQITTISSKYN